MIKVGQELEGILSMNASGSAYFSNSNIAREIYIYKSNTQKALHLDLVKIKVIKGKGRELEGVVIDIVKRVKDEYVGTIQIQPEHAFLIPDSNKMPVDIFVASKDLNGAVDGQKVVVKITKWGKTAKCPNGEVIKVLGSAGTNEVEMHSILHEYGLPYDFDEDVLAESEIIPDEIKESDLVDRRDMRNVMTFTIDPEDAKDFDDALSVDWSFGNLQVGVHIADVSHYLRPDTDLDKEAYRRGTSIYLVDRCIPMLPERLSNGICSLRPHEDKLCFSAVFTLDSNGAIKDEWFGKTIINSNHRYTYESAQEIIEQKIRINETDQDLLDLNRMAKILRDQRLKDSSLTFDKHEIKFKLVDNKPVDIIFKVPMDSNKLIEEFMLLANKRVAYYLRTNEFPVIQRVHEEPSPEKLVALKKFVAEVGDGYEIKIKTPQEITKTLNKLLLDIKGKPEENLISNLVIRTMQKAFYTTKNLGHYGLGFEDYAHFTSPIRRYPDIMIHRLLNRLLTKKPVPKLDKLEQRCAYLSQCEIKAQKAERDSQKYMQAVYMSTRIGQIYEGIVTSITEYGMFVEIIENSCNGLIRFADVREDNYVADVANHRVKGTLAGNTITLGDRLRVVVGSVDIERKNINLKIHEGYKDWDQLYG